MAYKNTTPSAADIVGKAPMIEASAEQFSDGTVKSNNITQDALTQGNYSASANQLQGPTEIVSGILDQQPEGHGFLRPKFIPSNRDVYISQSQIRRFLLRPGDLVAGIARPPKDNERYYGLLKVEKVNGLKADMAGRRPYFDDL